MWSCGKASENRAGVGGCLASEMVPTPLRTKAFHSSAPTPFRPGEASSEDARVPATPSAPKCGILPGKLQRQLGTLQSKGHAQHCPGAPERGDTPTPQLVMAPMGQGSQMLRLHTAHSQNSCHISYARTTVTTFPAHQLVVLQPRSHESSQAVRFRP